MHNITQHGECTIVPLISLAYELPEHVHLATHVDNNRLQQFKQQSASAAHPPGPSVGSQQNQKVAPVELHGHLSLPYTPATSPRPGNTADQSMRGEQQRVLSAGVAHPPPASPTDFQRGGSSTTALIIYYRQPRRRACISDHMSHVPPDPCPSSRVGIFPHNGPMPQSNLRTSHAISPKFTVR